MRNAHDTEIVLLKTDTVTHFTKLFSNKTICCKQHILQYSISYCLLTLYWRLHKAWNIVLMNKMLTEDCCLFTDILCTIYTIHSDTQLYIHPTLICWNTGLTWNIRINLQGVPINMGIQWRIRHRLCYKLAL